MKGLASHWDRMKLAHQFILVGVFRRANSRLAFMEDFFVCCSGYNKILRSLSLSKRAADEESISPTGNFFRGVEHATNSGCPFL